MKAPRKYHIKKGEPEDSPPDDDISSSPIRLSLGELLLSRARLRFTESLYAGLVDFTLFLPQRYGHVLPKRPVPVAVLPHLMIDAPAD
jgi:hypothetical protein